MTEVLSVVAVEERSEERDDRDRFRPGVPGPAEQNAKVTSDDWSAVHAGAAFDLLCHHDFPNNAKVSSRERRCIEARGGSIEIEDDPLDRNPDVWMYRARTIGMLRRYLRYSLDTGRVPSLLGGQYFRSGITSYGTVTFEDRVIFVYDMEICLARLSELSRKLIARYVLQEHTCEETAKLLHCNEKTVRRNVPLALDQLSEMLLNLGLLQAMNSNEKKSCQDVEIDKLLASDCELGK